MPSIKERNAAVDAVEPKVMEIVPAMFHGYVTETVVLGLVDAALNAAESVRNAQKEPSPAAP